MVDQPITFKNTVNVGGSQGTTTVPLKLYGAVGQTTHLIDLYQDPTQSQPGWGIAALGAMGWGPSGSGAQDTFLSRIATQNGHASDTAGLLVSPYLEVAGGIGFNGALNFLSSGASIQQGGAGSLALTFNQDLTVNRDATVTRRLSVAGTPANALPSGIVLTGQFQSTSGTGATGQNIGSSVGPQTAVNGTAVYHLYVQGGFNANGATGTIGVAIAAYPLSVSSGYAQVIAVDANQPQGGSQENISVRAGGLTKVGGYLQVYGSVQAPTTGSGLRMYGGGDGVVQAYNAGASSWTNLYLQGQTIYVQGSQQSAGGRVIITPYGSVSNVAGTVGAPSGSTTSSSWVAAPSPFYPGITLVVQSGAVGVLIWGNVQMIVSSATPAAPKGFQIAVGVDGSVWMGVISQLQSYVSNGTQTWPFCVFYNGMAAGTHTIQLYWNSPDNATTINWSTTMYSHLSAMAIFA